ncbi:MAG: hypothetical protein IPG55_02490 [Saprospiraceae bacterium]|nr:hypothetical protein [Candidatus Defluviibacterium haderslevense]MCC7028359.1 hypothetical protein [Saprospiraceae bacterium]
MNKLIHYLTLSFVFILGFGMNLSSQVPITQMYSAYIENPKDTVWEIRNINYLTAFNPKNYNSQPFQLSESTFLASIRTGKSDKNQIYEFHLNDSTYNKLIENKGYNYSPRIHPKNNNQITCVHVPESDSTIQQLIAYNKITGKEEKKILQQQGKIGYYRYWKDSKWICFIVDDINVLAICDENSTSRKVFASNIGRAFELLNQDELLFVHKILDDTWLLKKYNITQEKLTMIALMPKGVEDFYLMNSGQIICAQNSKLLMLSPTDKRWIEIADLKSLGIQNINRLTINNHQLIFVSTKT